MICRTGEMEEAKAAEVMAESAVVLRNAGARFAYLYGSRASGHQPFVGARCDTASHGHSQQHLGYQLRDSAKRG